MEVLSAGTEELCGAGSEDGIVLELIVELPYEASEDL